jgi:uncharacterized repeat protein (TIGR03803 family)
MHGKMVHVVSCIALILSIDFGLAVVTTQSAHAQTFTLLYSFAGSPDGSNPYAGLAQDKAGNLYGTTTYGGASNWGTVFKVDTSDRETVLLNFSYSKGYGANPYGGLVSDAAGNLYGTTIYGGSYGQGLVFKLDSAGKETVLHNFSGGIGDGGVPYDVDLVLDGAGNLYGTTGACGAFGYGTVFKVSKSGKETVLYSFAGGAGDGCNPYAAVVQDKTGNLYGTTPACGAHGAGMVFKLSKTGKETMLYSFCPQSGCTDGQSPYTGVIRDAKGNLYGTTLSGGTGDGGTIFKITSGKLTTLYSFCSQSGCWDGITPFARMIIDTKGNLYGTTISGGRFSEGVVYELDSSSTLTVLYSFAGGASDGCNPYGSVTQDTTGGSFYGTTLYCGASGFGTVWKLAP